MFDCIALLPSPLLTVTSLYLGVAFFFMCSFFFFNFYCSTYVFPCSHFSIWRKFKVVRDPDPEEGNKQIWMRVESELPFLRNGKMWVRKGNAVPLEDLLWLKQVRSGRPEMVRTGKLISRLLVNQRGVGMLL